MSNNLHFRLLFLFVFLLASNLVLAQQFTIDGKVINDDNIGIANVSIQILNSNYTTYTNENGDFTFKNISKGSYVVRFSSVGYAPENKTLLIDKNTTLEIKLSEVNSRLAEAVVTAFKQEGDPQRIPTSITVLGEKDIKDQYVWNIMDASAMVPNLNMSNPGDNRNVTSIRGIATSSYNPAIATYVDGVSQFNLDTYIPYLQDIERIEVLRGPQGTLYGRNAMGGVINIITKKPTNEPSGYAEVNIGNHGQQRYQLGFRTPLIKDKLFFGASGLFNKLDGFYTNDYNDSYYDKQHTAYGNFSLKYLPSESWSMTLNYKQVANRNNGAFPVVMGKETALEDPFHLNQNTLTQMIDNTKNASLSVNYYGRAFSFSSQTAYQANQRYYKDPIDGDFSPLDAISVINNYGKEWNKVKVLTQELKLSSAANLASPFSWTGGLYLFHLDNPEKQGTYYGKDAGVMGVPFTEVTSILTNKELGNGVAVYGQMGYKLVEGMEVLAGIRYDYEHTKSRGSDELELPDHSIQVIQADTSASANFSAFTPSVSLLYDLGGQHNVYGNYNRGFRAGGLSPVTSDPSDPVALRSFKPEYSDNFEIGSKNMFLDHRLLLNIAAFYTKVYDAQVPTFIMPDAVTITRNTGRMTSKGFEVELNAKALPNLDIYSSFGYTHARYTDLNIKKDEENEQLKGNRPISTPDWTSMLGAKYTYTFNSSRPQSIQINAYGKFLGHQYLDLNNSIDQKAYSLLNANISYVNKDYSIVIWGQNLANTTYLDYAYNFGAVHLGRPSTYGVTLRKSFGTKE